jgi:predicted nucleic acid-binding protein
VVEVASALAQVCRRNSWDVRVYDALDAKFFKDLQRQRILVQRVTAFDLWRARHLLRFAGVLKNRKLKSSDAIIAECCRELAMEKGERLVFYTADWKLYAILRDIQAYKSTMKLRYLGPGKGGIPPQTS